MPEFEGEYKTMLFSTIARFSHCLQQYRAARNTPFLSTSLERFAKLSNSHDETKSEGTQKQYWNWEKNDPSRLWRVILNQIESERIIEWLAKSLWRITQFYKELESNGEVK